MRSCRSSGTVRRLAAQGHLIGGSWVPGAAGGDYDHRYAATGQVQARIGLAGADDVDAAVRAARAAHPGWAALPPLKRARVLFRLADLLELHAGEAAELGALDNGTPISVMHPGRYAAAWVRYYAGWCDKLSGEVMSADPRSRIVRLEPYGVVAVIPPWNGSMMGMGQKCGPALAAGNTVVAKPPEVAPFGMLRFAELALEAGLPEGVLNVVVGGAEAGGALAGHPGVDKISFTGGGATARALMTSAAGNLTPLALELGGQVAQHRVPRCRPRHRSHQRRVRHRAAGRPGMCAPDPALRPRGRVRRDGRVWCVAALGSLTVGDPLDPGTFVGPVVTEAAMERILATIGRARSDGAELLAGGERLGGDLAGGWFVAPTVLGDVDHHSDLARNEVFGPVQAILRFTSDDEVLARANDSPYGLGAYLHTRDPGRIQRFVREHRVGHRGRQRDGPDLAGYPVRRLQAEWVRA